MSAFDNSRGGLIQRSMKTNISISIGAKCVTVVLLSLLILAGCRSKGPTFGSQSQQPPVPSGPAQTTYAAVVQRVSPAVVTIRSERRVRAPQQSPFFDDPSFRDLFGNRGTPQQQQPKESLEKGLGSGVIVSTDGYILTNHHVIDGAEQISVDMTDKRTFDAKLVGSDSLSD